MTAGALDGLVIADFGRVLAGPYATMLLGDLGAEVVKVERPGTGDDTRAWGPPYTDDGVTTYFQSVNRNKTSRSIDLGTDEGRTAALELAARADVMVENFLPGTLDRLGLGYADVQAANPDVIYCSITGFGGDSQLPGYDLVAQAVGGLMSITGPDPLQPTKAGVAVVDVLTGLHAAVGILAALRHRDQTGEGQRVEVNLLSVLLSSLVNQSASHVLAGTIPQAMGNAHPSLTPYEMLVAADKPLVIACGNDRQFAALATELGLAELAADERFATNAARVAHRDALIEQLSAVLRERPAAQWCQRLNAVGVPAGPVNNLAEAFDFAQSLGLEPIVDVAGKPGVANPIRLSATPVRYASAPPPLA